MNRTAEQLRAIRNFEDLIRYLEDELDWPLQEYGFDQLTFEYSPEELGIKEQDAAKIGCIYQLRPLYTGQPWGIFFVEFEHKKLPVVVLRRILSHLVVKKRASANKSSAAAWNTEDLLFISAYGEEETEQREIAFAHFHQEPGDLPSLRVLGWDGADTLLKLAHVNRVLHERLRWPANPGDQQAWRDQWRAPFRHRIGHVINTADGLAEVLAQLARNIRDRAQTMLGAEAVNGPLRTLHKAFRTSLIHDLSEESFADTYAQTITYGLLTAAISRTDRSEGRHGTALIAENITDMVPVTNPFLKEMLQTFLRVGGRKGGIDFDELGIQDVVELLRGKETDLPAILRDFGNRTRGEDPVIHFYEHFLAAYNKKLKVQRGVFYTPQPVVSYIVRSVHELLQTEFGLEDGLASTITWREMEQRNLPLSAGEGQGEGEFKIPAGTDPDSPFVIILDPATGTATFLVEVIDVIYRTLNEKWRKQGMGDRQREAAWNGYVPKHLLPRLYGYELMMAPYAIAHMKIGLKLHETGYRFGSNERARVYLTNALELASDYTKQMEFEEVLPALAHEAKAVNTVKLGQRFTVVIGNPPYSISSQNKSLFIDEIMELYKIDVRHEPNIKPLSDDYVKFFRFAHYLAAQAKFGVISFITNNSFLWGPTFLGMRKMLSADFPALYLLNLHGDSLSGETTPSDEKDENIFDIRQGVVISIGSRSPSILARNTGVWSSDIYGSRQLKYGVLGEQSSKITAWQKLENASNGGSFIRSDQTHKDEYLMFPILTDVLTKHSKPILTKRDHLVIHFDKAKLIETLHDLCNLPYKEFVERYSLEGDSRDWTYAAARRTVQSFGIKDEFIQKVHYRPFDQRWTYYVNQTKGFMAYPVYGFLSHMLRENLALCVPRQINQMPWQHALPANGVIEYCYISNKTREQNDVFPLYSYDKQSGIFGVSGARCPNLAISFLAQLSKRLFLRQSDIDGLPQGITPEYIFHYIYSVLHSFAYRTRYSEFLKIDFPRIPLPGSPELFQELFKLGGELVSLHLLESSRINQFITHYQGEGDHSILKQPVYKDGAVWINAAQRFENVPEAVWNFHIGGYQVCKKWLKDRKGRCLSEEDIVHYQKIVVALNETIRLMQEIDAVINRHGGWPAAFQQAENGRSNDSEK